MELDRQPWPERRDQNGRPPPQRVPETRPTPLQDWFIYLSIVVLICGVVAISALELGTAAGDPLVRVPVVIGGSILAVLSLDAFLRVWRSAWAWLPVDRGRGLFRFVWAAVLAASFVAAVTGVGYMLAV